MRHLNTACNTLALLLTVLPALARADHAHTGTEPVRAVRLSDVEGSVKILQDGQPLFDQVRENMPVLAGMAIQTGDDGRVEMQFEDGSVARLTPNSALRVDTLDRRSDGTLITGLTATGGLSYFELNGGSSQYTVALGHQQISTTQSSIFRVDLDTSPATVAVTHGMVHIGSPDMNGFDLSTSQTASLDLEHPRNYDIADTVKGDSWDQWNSDRDQVLAQLGSAATSARASTSTPDDRAWNDLDYYGNWYNVPGYGMAWSPNGVGDSFDPFGDGYWGYYNTVGYTWISAYPWGWWPYHCGAWNYFAGAGWLWFPGGCGLSHGGGWYPYVSVWNLPPHYEPPARPVLPVHGGTHMPRQMPLVAVDRTGPPHFRGIGEPRPQPHILQIDGHTVHPLIAEPHQVLPGSIGEGFTTAHERPGIHAPSTGVEQTLPGHLAGTNPGHIAGAEPGKIIVPGSSVSDSMDHDSMNQNSIDGQPEHGPEGHSGARLVYIPGERVTMPAEHGAPLPVNPSAGAQHLAPSAPMQPHGTVQPSAPHMSAPPPMPHMSMPPAAPHMSAPPAMPHISTPPAASHAGEGAGHH